MFNPVLGKELSRLGKIKNFIGVAWKRDFSQKIKLAMIGHSIMLLFLQSLEC